MRLANAQAPSQPLKRQHTIMYGLGGEEARVGGGERATPMHGGAGDDAARTFVSLSFCVCVSCVIVTL